VQGNTCKHWTRHTHTTHTQIPGFARALAAGSIKHLIVLSLLVLCAFSILHWVVLKDTAGLNSNMVPAPALCASQDDMYDTASRLCQVGNKYAFWYLRHKDWVQCAPNLPGFALLQQSQDLNGNFWYNFKHSKKIRAFYDTCIPECATDEDTFHSSKDMCLVTDQVLLSFMAGPCEREREGEGERGRERERERVV
jgi:hypothetical protein